MRTNKRCVKTNEILIIKITNANIRFHNQNSNKTQPQIKRVAGKKFNRSCTSVKYPTH